MSRAAIIASFILYDWTPVYRMKRTQGEGWVTLKQTMLINKEFNRILVYDRSLEIARTAPCNPHLRRVKSEWKNLTINVLREMHKTLVWRLENYSVPA